MKLEELQKSLGQMTLEEKQALIRDIRDDRRVSKHAVSHKAKKEKDRVDRVAGKFAQLTVEEQEELMKLLGEGDGA